MLNEATPYPNAMANAMNSSPATYRASAAESSELSPKFGAALEILASLTAVAAATLCFLMGWLTSDGAAVLTVLLLVSLIGLAWKRFDGGRHPCFFFLCMLALFQAGRLIAYCAEGETDIFRITLMTSEQFDVSRNVAGSVLLLIALSAVCIYAPCRWNYRPFSPAPSRSFGRFLPYLYLLFSLSVPVQLYKNFCYYQYAPLMASQVCSPPLSSLLPARARQSMSPRSRSPTGRASLLISFPILPTNCGRRSLPPTIWHTLRGRILTPMSRCF